MVRLALAVWMLGVAAACPVAAQEVDWSRAGGDMFGAEAPPAPREPEDGEARLAERDPPFRQALAEAAARHGLDDKLLQALVAVESGFRPRAVSSAGAAGLTQLMPGTARELGVEDRFDPADNLRGGAEYLARQLLKFQDLRLARAAFNAGPARVERLGLVPKIPETEAYVDLVLSCYLALAAGRDVRSAGDCRSPERRP
jgi:soluble lytic murein transglycosylase-like protein